MKKTVKILIPFILTLTIILCMVWYLFVYDRTFTRDMFLSFARYCDENGKHAAATWFYDKAYAQSTGSDAVAIELAEQYKQDGNYTKAEFTLSNAIADGGGLDLYVALCKTFVEQDKLKDAVAMLNNVTNPEIKAKLDAMRPQAPQPSHNDGKFNQYISVSFTSASGTLYVTADGEYPSVADLPYLKPITLVDGENKLKAISVAENGLVSDLVELTYTVGGVIELVEFSDPAVEEAIRTALSADKDTQIYTDDIWELRDFTVPATAKNLDDLKHLVFLEELTITAGAAGELNFLELMTNLKKLNISAIAIDQNILAKIAALPNLESLTLQGCSLSNISVLAEAKKLIDLNLTNNQISNIDSIGTIKTLENLILKTNAISDLSPLSGNKSLKQLDISGNSVVSLAPICGLSTLTRLDASVNKISDFGNMQTLISLEYLSLVNNGITDISKISACQSIKELHISDNKLTDVSALSNLPTLMYLNMANNQVSQLPTFVKDAPLVSIDCSKNKLTSLDALAELKSLSNIYAGYNDAIKSVKNLSKCPMLVHVDVFGTKVKDVNALTSKGVFVITNDSPR